MSIEKVRSLENAEPVNYQNDILIYKGKIANKKVDIFYNFINDRLVSGKYIFSLQNVNLNKYINDYETINDFILIKYGNPEISKVTWNDNLYKEKKGFYGLAVSIGHLVLYSLWKDSKTVIAHNLSGENNIINHSVTYSDIIFFDWENDSLKKDEIEGL